MSETGGNGRNLAEGFCRILTKSVWSVLVGNGQNWLALPAELARNDRKWSDLGKPSPGGFNSLSARPSGIFYTNCKERKFSRMKVNFLLNTLVLFSMLTSRNITSYLFLLLVFKCFF